MSTNAPQLTTCATNGCTEKFYYIEARLYPELCIDHQDDAIREANGWTPANSQS